MIMLEFRDFTAIGDGTYVFKPVGDLSVWTCVNQPNLAPLWLSSFLQICDVIVDDDTQFARVIRYTGESVKGFRHTLTYRHYNDAKIVITITHTKIN